MNAFVIIPLNYAFCIALALSFSLPQITSFVVGSSKRTAQLQVKAVTDSSEANININNRRDFLLIANVRVLSGITGVTILTSHSYPAVAVDEEEELPTREVVTECFNSVRYELQDLKGGVAFMQGRIDNEDWLGLLEFTKTYDLEMRKLRMGRAKKLLQDKEIKAKATSYANAVTFDLIGINRSSRKGQENVESANKYLQELREDMIKFLDLEETIKVQT